MTDIRYQPYAQTRTTRREYARTIRAQLGTSRDGAPSTAAVLRASIAMSRLLHDSTQGMLDLQVVDRDGQPVNFTDAYQAASKDWAE